jgi:aspartyl-tRNA synthetase
LRREEMQQVLRFRAKINQIIRLFFNQNGNG